MTKQEILQQIVAVVNALNNVSVKGEENLGNLSGSITLLKEILKKEYEEQQKVSTQISQD